MNQMLVDLIAAHRNLCEAVTRTQIDALPSISGPYQSSPTPSKRPSQEDPFLSDAEEKRLEELYGLQANPLMDQIVSQQFATLSQQYEKNEKYEPAPEPTAAPKIQQRPRIVTPEPTPMSLSQEDEVPAEIAMADKLVAERMQAPEQPFKAQKTKALSGGDILNDLALYMQTQG